MERWKREVVKSQFIFKKAFTLAEVLITLGIIGIVAEITIPTLLGSATKQMYVALLQKNYTIFSQGLLSLSTDMGCAGDMKCTGLFATGTTPQALGDAIIPYFKVIKNCQMNVNQGCAANSRSNYYDGSGSRSSGWDGNAAYYKFVTADGSSILIYDWANGCTDNYGSGSLSQTCGPVIVDVNGAKGPNNYGRDIFLFIITSTGSLYPYGGPFMNSGGTSYYWKDLGACQPATSSTISGSYCTGRVMDEGWQMNY